LPIAHCPLPVAAAMAVDHGAPSLIWLIVAIASVCVL
jgi:hypothetical protein